MRAPRRRALAFAAVFLAAGLLSWADPVRSGEAGKPAFPETAEAAAPRTCTCELEGQIEDCCCAFGDIDQLNGQIAPLLSRLMKTTFFRFYKADMHRKCLFWDDDEGKCGKRACTVESCPDEEVPSAVRQQETAAAFQCAVRSTGLESGVSLGLLNDTITESEQAAFETWQLHDNRLHTYCDVGDEADGVAKYVNLVDNPERFTGYAGNSAARIWRSIYMENCFKPEQDVKYLTSMVVNAMCLEKRVFHRVVSGLHATINIHVAASYPKPSSASGVPTFVLGPDTLSSEVEEWGPNITLFRKFFSPQRTFGEGPKWLKNVYFTYAMLVRAVLKAAPMWDPRHFHTGNAEEDEEVNGMVQDLIETALRMCPSTFDEAVMFASQQDLKEEFRSHFRNITRIMDCVGCNTCRLWGKLKVHGLGTAMKILFADEGVVHLNRNEVVALFNTLNQFAHSISEITVFRDMEREDERRGEERS